MFFIWNLVLFFLKMSVKFDMRQINVSWYKEFFGLFYLHVKMTHDKCLFKDDSEIKSGDPERDIVSCSHIVPLCLGNLFSVN